MRHRFYPKHGSRLFEIYTTKIIFPQILNTCDASTLLCGTNSLIRWPEREKRARHALCQNSTAHRTPCPRHRRSNASCVVQSIRGSAGLFSLKEGNCLRTLKRILREKRQQCKSTHSPRQSKPTHLDPFLHGRANRLEGWQACCLPSPRIKGDDSHFVSPTPSLPN